MRLNDLRCNWLRQYFPELSSFEASADADVSGQLGVLDGYLSQTSAAVLLCSRMPADWESLANPWASLSEMIARYQAEFSGRILMGTDDADRWQREPADGLCWGLIGVDGFDFLVRTAADLDGLQRLFGLGVRLFQPIATSRSLLGGSSEPGDDPGLTELGRQFLETLATLAEAPSPQSSRPILDLARMSPTALDDVLTWLEADAARAGGILLAVSHGSVERADSPRDGSGEISLDLVRRIRALGGTIGLSVGLPFLGSPDELLAQIRTLAAIPFDGREGMEGIAIGTSYLGGTVPLPDFKNVAAILRWLGRTFDKPSAQAIRSGNARELFLKAAGATSLGSQHPA